MQIAEISFQKGFQVLEMSFEEPNDGGNRVFRRNFNAPMHMIRHQMSLHNATLFLTGQFMKNRSQKLSNVPKHHLAAIFRDKDNVILAVPLGMRQALIQFRHCFFLLRMYGSSHRRRYFTAGTLKAFRVALVKPVAYLRYSVTTVYGLVAFDPPCSIELSLPKKDNTLKIEKIISEKKILEANISSKLSIFSRELSVEAQEKIAYFLIFMISFASGRKVIEAYQRSEVKSAEEFKIDEYWRGSRSRAVAKGFRVIQEPHLKLFLEQLISKEDGLELYRESLLLSLSWYLETFESNILATNFVLLCTAIEAFNEEFKKTQQSSTNRLISKPKYKAVRKSILQCVDEHESDLHGDDDHEKYAIFKAKIESVFNSGSLNMVGNLSANLQEMLKYFKVKYDDLFPEFDFIKIRNNVIHRGTHDFDEMFDVYLRLESLYIRLILCVLGYNGDYMEHNGTGLICRTVPFV
jgi:hypothetical protein